MNVIELKKRLFSEEQSWLKQKILNDCALGHAEGLKIYEQYFKYMPNRLRYLKEKYELDKKKILDLGCGMGQFLIHFGKGSIGIELDNDKVKIAEGLGLDVRKSNVEENIGVSDNYFDGAWCSNILEHVFSPYLLLCRIQKKLKADGLLFIGIPTVPGNNFFKAINRLLLGFSSYESIEHISAFTDKTAKFAVQRAGFKIIDSGVFVTRHSFLNKALQPLVCPLASQVVIVAQKTNSWEKPHCYPPGWAK